MEKKKVFRSLADGFLAVDYSASSLSIENADLAKVDNKCKAEAKAITLVRGTNVVKLSFDEIEAIKDALKEVESIEFNFSIDI